MIKLTIEELKHPIGKQLVLKISERMANYQGDADFEVSKIYERCVCYLQNIIRYI